MSVDAAGLARDDRADDGQPDRAADLERGLHEAGGQALLVVGDAVGRLRCSASGSRARSRGRAAASSAGASSDVGRRDVDAAGTARSRRRTTARRAAISRAVPKRSTSGPIRVEPNATSRPAGRNASAVSIADQPFSACRYSVMTNWKPT